MFLASPERAFIQPPGNNQGIFCLGLPRARLGPGLGTATAEGTLRVTIDLGAIPMDPPVQILPGETWTFQAWYSDQNPGPVTNLTGAVSVTFR